MKTLKIVLFVAIILATQNLSAQQHKQWEKWSFLMGEWVGEGNGQPGQGSGSFSFTTDLDENIIVRKSITEFPATKDKPASTHKDLMYIYHDNTGNSSKSIYFDNEGHVINYTITYAENSTVFTSDIIQNTPRFRLSYFLINKDTLNVKFEFAPPQNPESFKTYIEGKCTRKK